MQISFAVNMKLISTFVFAAQIVQCLYFLNPKPSFVTVKPGLCRTWLKPKLLVFSHTGSNIFASTNNTPYPNDIANHCRSVEEIQMYWKLFTKNKILNTQQILIIHDMDYVIRKPVFLHMQKTRVQISFTVTA